MANEAHLAQLTKGLEVWDQWRMEHPYTHPDLYRADLSGVNLSGVDLSEADLSEADLSRANLSGASLSRANLSGADLSDANLSGADLRGANLRWAKFSGADLSEADLSRADLGRANLSGADLSGANLNGANLDETIGLDNVEIAERHAIEVEIALPQENINYIDLEQLQMAIDNLMKICEFELKAELDPIQGSWWQTLIFWSKNKTTQTAVNRLFQTLKEVLVARTIGIPSAEETVKLATGFPIVLAKFWGLRNGDSRVPQWS